MTPLAPCALLDWDSTFFARRIGRLRDGALDPERLAAIERWCRAERIDALYFLAPIDDPETVALAEGAGFRLRDVRVTLGRSLAPSMPPSEGTEEPIRPARPADLPALRRIAAVSHRDSRFYADPHFARERSDELYATWIEKSCASAPETHVWVADWQGQPAGYVTARLARPEPNAAATGEIGLLAVAESAQGHGLGRLLVGRALEDLAARGAARVTVVTQGRNLRAQRLYQRCGFSTAALGLWFHRWFEPTPL